MEPTPTSKLVYPVSNLDGVHSEQHPPSIVVQKMPHQLDVWKNNEDWAGLTSTDQRRKLQNRLNQRAHRRRQLLEKNRGVATQQHRVAASEAASQSHEPISTHQQQLDMVATKLDRVRRFSEQAYAGYLGQNPSLENLPRVVQINVFNALARNAGILGDANAWLLCDSVSAFGLIGPSRIATSIPRHAYPDNLYPTALQVSISHHPWIDLLPWPKLRDTFLRLTQDELVDEDELCHDIVELDTSLSPADKPGFVVWGEPWDPHGWEASPAFLRKWGWTLYGCTDIIEATNHWRRKRGERLLSLAHLRNDD